METEKISRRVVGAIIATGIMSFSGVLVETAMNVTFPALMREFSVSIDLVQWMTTIYLLMVAIVVPLSSWLKRNIKMRNLFLLAILLFISGVVIDAVALSFPILLLGRLIQGLGVGVALPLMFNIILEQVPKAKLGLMMGVGTLITSIAPAIGPTFGGIMVTSLGWRYIFISLVPFLLIALVIGLRSIDQKSALVPSKFNGWNLFYVVLMFVGLIFAASKLSLIAEQPVQFYLPLIIGIFGVLGFFRVNQGAQPVVDVRLLKNRAFLGHTFSFAILQSMVLGLSFVLPNYIQLVNGASATTAGLIVLPGSIVGAIFAPLGGRILDRFGSRRPILIGGALVLLSLAIFAIFGQHLQLLVILLVDLIFMAGFGLSLGNVMTSGLGQIEPLERADGNALLTTVQQFAGALGTAIPAAIVALSQAHATTSQAHATAVGSQLVLLMFAILAFLQWLVLYRVVQNKK